METSHAQRVGARIKAARERANLSQVDLGNQIGLSGSAISQYESGIREVGLSELYAIARVLSLLPSYFIEGDSSGDHPDTVRSIYADNWIDPHTKEILAGIVEREHEKYRERRRQA